MKRSVRFWKCFRIYVNNFRSYLFCGILCLLIGTCYHEFTWCFQNSLNDKEVDIFHDLFKYLAECRRYKNFSIPSLGSIQSLQAMRNIGETRIRRESPLLILLSWTTMYSIIPSSGQMQMAIRIKRIIFYENFQCFPSNVVKLSVDRFKPE